MKGQGTGLPKEVQVYLTRNVSFFQKGIHALWRSVSLFWL